MPTQDGQLYADEFISEVIGIDRLRHLNFDLTGNNFVLASSSFGHDLQDQQRFFSSAPTIGLALADMREKIRAHYGR